MADKPSRALVIYGDGLARFVDSTHTHIHSLGSLACCGFLSLPNSPPSESEDARVVREFSQLLDAYDAYAYLYGEGTAKVENQGKSSISTISERFMGMRAAIITDNSIIKSFGGKLGFSLLEMNAFSNDAVAMESLKLLGFQEGNVLETNEFDIVFLHIGARKDTFQKDIEYVNALVGGLVHVAKAGSEIGSRLHLSLILSYGDVIPDDDLNFSFSSTNHEANSNLSSLYPRQSYAMKGSNLREDVRLYCPMLVSQWQSGVTRKDMVQKVSFHDFEEHCGNLTVPADRFLYEVAFKLWKAPKYGA